MSSVISLTWNSTSIKYLSSHDKRINKVIHLVGPISYKPYEDSYHFMIDTIVGQMLSNKVADIMCDRLSTLCNGQVTPKIINLLTDNEIRSIGVAWSKVEFIRTLTDKILAKQLDFKSLKTLNDDCIIKQLTAIKGIGSWSAKMYLIFVLNRQDVLPYEDGAFLQGYSWIYRTNDYSIASIRKKCKKWSPYASIAARYLYKALDLGLTKTEFHLFK
jgi:DNA-3-methyladenine glycosylase II